MRYGGHSHGFSESENSQRFAGASWNGQIFCGSSGFDRNMLSGLQKHLGMVRDFPKVSGSGHILWDWSEYLQACGSGQSF